MIMQQPLSDIYLGLTLTSTLILAALNPGIGSAICFVAAVALVGSVLWRRPQLTKPASEDDIKAFREELKTQREALGAIRASIGLKGVSRRSIFETATEG